MIKSVTAQTRYAWLKKNKIQEMKKKQIKCCNKYIITTKSKYTIFRDCMQFNKLLEYTIQDVKFLVIIY